MASFSHLPTDVLLGVASELDLEDTIRLSQVCYATYTCSQHAIFWIQILHKIRAVTRSHVLPIHPHTPLTSLDLASLRRCAALTLRVSQTLWSIPKSNRSVAGQNLPKRVKVPRIARSLPGPVILGIVFIVPGTEYIVAQDRLAQDEEASLRFRLMNRLTGKTLCVARVLGEGEFHRVSGIDVGVHETSVVGIQRGGAQNQGRLIVISLGHGDFGKPSLDITVLPFGLNPRHGVALYGDLCVVSDKADDENAILLRVYWRHRGLSIDLQTEIPFDTTADHARLGFNPDGSLYILLESSIEMMSTMYTYPATIFQPESASPSTLSVSSKHRRVMEPYRWPVWLNRGQEPRLTFMVGGQGILVTHRIAFDESDEGDLPPFSILDFWDLCSRDTATDTDSEAASASWYPASFSFHHAEGESLSDPRIIPAACGSTFIVPTRHTTHTSKQTFRLLRYNHQAPTSMQQFSIHDLEAPAALRDRTVVDLAFDDGLGIMYAVDDEGSLWSVPYA